MRMMSNESPLSDIVPLPLPCAITRSRFERIAGVGDRAGDVHASSRRARRALHRRRSSPAPSPLRRSTTIRTRRSLRPGGRAPRSRAAPVARRLPIRTEIERVPVASPAWKRGESTTSASRSRTSTRRCGRTSASSAAVSSIGRASTTRASRRRRSASATSRIELLAALGDDTPVGKFLAKRGPGMHHVAYEVDDVRAAVARARRGRRRADRQRAAAGHVRARGRVRASGIGSRRSFGGGVGWLTVSAYASRSDSRAGR